ncbi:disease resistance protein RLM3-like isoform X2 [Apium graveolens]|uniref:disease resistance protein RLM3-like isoform X2 n=1 Tax=Apium graveolens TaxID=4045 RepID=UPI003D7B3817
MAFDKRIDVFLNFSAEDIGKNFGAHLHRSLRRADIQTITGDVSRSDTLSSVQQSRISVVVFSKNYASSAQALDELVNIRECSGTGGLVVLPVFYNFDRYSLMNQLETSKGEHELQQTGSMSRWRQALEEISSMPGYDLYKFADRAEMKQLVSVNSLRQYYLNCTSSIQLWTERYSSFYVLNSRLE